MSFARVEFVFVLAIVVGAFQFVPARWRPHALLAISAVFYVCGAEREWHAFVLAASIALTYACGLGIEAARAKGGGAKGVRAWAAVGVVGNVALLAAFKYQRTWVAAWEEWTGTGSGDAAGAIDVVLPLGISFYSFQAISYVVDVAAGRARACWSLLELALYLCFFPLVVSGPIERIGHLLPQLRATRWLNPEDLSVGVRRIGWGLLKKLVVADRLRVWAMPVLAEPGERGAAELWVAGAVMMAVLYQDFGAYTDIARGCARLFGVELVENFRLPFLATSVPEFWRRWHMSLTGWIADYVVSPMTSARRVGVGQVWRNSLVALGLFGVWHGASWKFLGWGLLVGVETAVVNTVVLVRRRKGRKAPSGWWYVGAAWLATMAVGALDMGVFFAPDARKAWECVAGMVGLGRASGAGAMELLGVMGVLAACLAVHALGAVVELEKAWARIGVVGRAAVMAAGVWGLWWWRVAEPEGFIYVGF